jgi:hypothetical protein
MQRVVRAEERQPSAPDGKRLSGPDTMSGRLQRACLVQLRKHERDGEIPTNGRFIFYELEQLGVVPKYYDNKKRSPAHDIADALLWLRKYGHVPWEWIKDETREVNDWEYAPSVYQYMVNQLDYARIDCWDGTLPPLIICESRATKGVLAETVTYEYLTPITATGGQCGGFIVTDIVPLLRDNDREVLYIGDCEVGGPADQIEANTRRYIEDHSGRVFTAKTWSRVALTRAQVNRMPAVRKLAFVKEDRRYKPAREYEAIECEAVGQKVLTKLLRARLDALLPEPLEAVRVREQLQRDDLEKALAHLDRKARRQP